MANEIREIAFEMDSVVNGIGTKLQNVNDVNDFLGNLRIKLDNLDDELNARIALREVHSDIRLLSELLRYTVNDLNESHDQMEVLKDQLFKRTVNEQQGANIVASS